MSGRAVERIEMAIDVVAATLFAAAAGFAALSLSRAPVYPRPEIAGAVTALVSFLVCCRGLRSVGRAPRRLVLPRFDSVLGFDLAELGELVLTDADRLRPVDATANDELVLTDAHRLHRGGDEPLELDDVLSDIGPESRVVRLFDPSTMPTPGQLKARIDRHLDGGAAAAPPADASQALFEALAELRRSLA